MVYLSPLGEVLIPTNGRARWHLGQAAARSASGNSARLILCMGHEVMVRNLRNWSLFLTLLLGLVQMSVAGCSSGGGGGSSSATAEQSTPTPTSAPTATPAPIPTPTPTHTPTPTPTPVPLGSINGLYYLGIPNSTVFDSAVLANPNVDGLAYRGGWATFEPTEGVYDWSQIDGVIATANATGKKVSISITAGYQTPAWVYADGAASFSFVWDEPGGPGYCTVQAIPLPWDAVFLAKWQTFITVLGARYNSNPTVAHVKLTGINGKTAEDSLPHTINENINSGQCTGYNDVANWGKAGYTRVKVLNAWEQIAGYWKAALPNREIASILLPCGFPPIDDNGNVISGDTCDSTLMTEMNSYGLNSPLGRGVWIAQNNGLNPTWIDPTVVADASYVDTGYQETGAQGTEFGATCDLVVTNDGKFLEAYKSDLTLASNAGAIAACHSGLIANAPTSS